MRRRASRLVLWAIASAALGSAAAQAATFRAALDREAVAPGEPFVYEVTLSLGGEGVDGFRAPDFHGLQVIEAPRFPSQSTSMQFGGGQPSFQNSYSWTYQLAVPAGAKGSLTIGAAHVRVAGRELTTNTVVVRVGASSAPSNPRAAAPAGPGNLFQQLFQGGARAPLGDDGDQPGAVASSASAFIRVVPDKTRVYIGEQVTVGWYLYVTQVPNRFGQISSPRTDGFWSEDIPSTNPAGRLSFEARTEGGRSYNVALLFKKALFPLAPGKLTVTPMEAEVAQVDFFGAPTQARRLKTDPLVIEAQALPREGAPPQFDVGNVGRYQISASVDRTAVAVGDAVTLKVVVKGTGNVRNVSPPAMPALDGWKSYEPKTDVAVDGGETIAGTKTVEWLLRPERAGKTTIPAFVMETFDPAARRYGSAHTAPIEIVVTGEAGASAGAGSGLPAGAGVENVVAGSIRPIHARAALSGEAGVAFLHSGAFTATVVTPPLALAVLGLFGRVRARLGRDTRRTRRRRFRSMARRRLRAAEADRAAGRAAAFYLEIDRVVREALSERLGTELGGLRRDELVTLLGARGLPADETARVVSAIDACDEARFSPGGTAGDPAALSSMLARAEELIDAIERAPLGEGGRS